jgi:ppGpp synthetase/RelA/SpoT-type nucleotidyltranferase
MKRKVKIVNEGVKFDKKKYEGVFGDYDKDGVVNIDDANPTNKNKKGKVEPVPASKTFSDLLKLKKELDKVMEDSVDILKEKTPKDADIYARTKTPYSIIKKLVEKRLMHPEKGLQDLVGTTIAVDSYEDLIEVRNKIRKGTLGEVIEEEDMYSNPKQGYMAYHYIVKVGKIPVEVQLKTKRMKDVNSLTHEFYKSGTLNSKEMLSLVRLTAKADKGDKKAIAEYNSKMKDKSALKRSLDTSKMAKGGAIQYATKWSEKSPYSITVYEKDGEKIHLTYLSKDGVNQFKKKFPKAVVSIGKVDKDGTITDEYAKGGTVEEKIKTFMDSSNVYRYRSESDKKDAVAHYKNEWEQANWNYGTDLDDYLNEISENRKFFKSGGQTKTKTNIELIDKGGTVEEMNTELAKKDYSNNKINVKRRFYTTKNGKLMVKETATGRRTTPRKLIRHLLHESYTGNTKYAELDNGTHFIEDSKGKLHPIYDASARQKGSVTEYYQGDIDDYSEYEVMVELEVKPSKIYEKNKKLVKGGAISSKKNGGKVDDDMLYEFSYKDDEGDLYEEAYETLAEAKKSIKEIKSNGGKIVETWIYKNGDFKGRFSYAKGGMVFSYDEIANNEFGMDYSQLGSGEKEWVRDEQENQYEKGGEVSSKKNGGWGINLEWWK